MIDRYKNWKTSTAFFFFIICFCYAVYKENVALTEATGFIVLTSWALLKASSDTFNDFVSTVGNAIKSKWSKE